eukprot:TRINITY_DN58094_c0_g1_i1.p1 TRINITY_DN58094_c0_g1~~TRINITY_DN58094_c0_g1_i1.p1  ORF type:complete len:422 (+),score=51.90 TRINITY_DN58094_c0_g1_i1:37-1266(+)
MYAMADEVVDPVVAGTRVVSAIFVKTKRCRFYLAGKCARGSQCMFAHTNDELRSSPDLRFTKLCPIRVRRGSCRDPTCTYAHSLDQLRELRHDKEPESEATAAFADAPVTAPHADVNASVRDRGQSDKGVELSRRGCRGRGRGPPRSSVGNVPEPSAAEASSLAMDACDLLTDYGLASTGDGDASAAPQLAESSCNESRPAAEGVSAESVLDAASAMSFRAIVKNTFITIELDAPGAQASLRRVSSASAIHEASADGSPFELGSLKEFSGWLCRRAENAAGRLADGVPNETSSRAHVEIAGDRSMPDRGAGCIEAATAEGLAVKHTFITVESEEPDVKSLLRRVNSAPESVERLVRADDAEPLSKLGPLNDHTDFLRNSSQSTGYSACDARNELVDDSSSAEEELLLDA